jgi:hypothetical protein
MRYTVALPRLTAILAVLMLVSTAFAAPRTMRVDYYHTGNAEQEFFSLDRIVIEPTPWPGNLARNIDETNLGKYFFEVIDIASGKVLYSRGFASIYGEWETTGEARRMNRTFHESLRFPEPEDSVRVVLKKRDAKNDFQEIWTFEIDPKDMFIDTAASPSQGPVLELEVHGDPADKVDLLILGDGYTEAERGKFEQDARRLIDTLFATSPFKERRTDFNVWGIVPAAVESGISRPSDGIHRSNPIGSTYDAFGSERYILTFNNRAFREIASFAPYEFVEILVNGETYGGGGIFGLYSTVAADNDQAPYVFIHELGHHLAGLADEYYTSSVAYLPATDRLEPWEPNATALLDPENLKWKDLVEPGTPIPTPWQKQEFERLSTDYAARRNAIRSEKRPEAEMEELFRTLRSWEEVFFEKEQYAGKVGAFEGAMYESNGYYRPAVNCIMFTRSPDFCPVCSRAIETVIDLYTKP